MGQLVSLVKRDDVDQAGDELERLCRGPCGPDCGCLEDSGSDETSDAGMSDAGMSTVEYAVGTVVAAAFAAVLYQIVTGSSVVAGLTDLIQRALATSF